MADKSPIEWTEATWNPVVGCSILSPGCTNCYAMKMAARIEAMSAGTGRSTHYAGTTQASKAGPVWTGKMALATNKTLIQPLRWKRPRMIFVNSMSDLFHEDVPDEWIDQVFAVMALAPQHTFQVLTKRSQRMRDYLCTRGGDWMLRWPEAIPAGKWLMSRHEGMSRLGANGPVAAAMYDAAPIHFPLPNVWLGVSTERQQEADDRIPELLATPAAVRFVSAEPLLGQIDFRQWQHDYGCGCGWGGDSPLDYCTNCGWRGRAPGEIGEAKCPDCRELVADYNACPECDGHDGDGMSFGPNSRPRLDWIIVGGESGTDARPMHPDWARSIRDQCAEAGVAFFFKQWGAWKPICEMPEDQIDACYRSNQKAKGNEDQAILDEMYGRTCIADSMVLHSDGTRHDPLAPMAFAAGTGAMTMFEIGKSRAGRLLDGREHNDMPEPREVSPL